MVYGQLDARSLVCETVERKAVDVIQVCWGVHASETMRRWTDLIRTALAAQSSKLVDVQCLQNENRRKLANILTVAVNMVAHNVFLFVTGSVLL